MPLERLAFVVSFADAQARVARHPFSEHWPLEILSTVSFAEHAGIGRGTAVVVRWSPINAGASEWQAFAGGRAGMEQAWAGTLARLTAYLAGA